ncbi:MAG TPA: GLPGLI family protein [Flavobacterium lutivivi]|nr:GLPGLI family protein [Flavobacterium lutivivi]
MKRKQILFILFFLSLAGFSQNGEITYSLLLNNVSDVSYENDLENELKNTIVKNKSTIKAKLFFNNEEMKFEIEKSTDLSINDYENILRITDNEGIFYKKDRSNFIYRFILGNSKYNNVICERKFITNWNFFNEKKIIAGYECLKAQCILGTDYGDGEIIYSYPVTAWYCPEIKNQYGPKGIGCLPGVILELNQNLVTFKASKINLNPPKKDISIPNEKIIKEMDLVKYIQSPINN